MFNYRVEFESPWYLLLLAVLPLLWWLSYRSLAGLGTVRRLLAIALRSILLTLVILALAELQWVRTSDRLTVLYLLDQSLSIPAAQRAAMRQYVNEAVALHRQRPEDRAGVIVFGRDPAMEIPPLDDLVQLAESPETFLDPEHTNLAAAMRLAQASFPEDSAKRIVIVTDGNENLGDARQQARGLVDEGIGIDVQPVVQSSRAEVVVESLAAPTEIRRAQPYDLRVVIANSAEPTADDAGTVTGQLTIKKKSGDQEMLVSEQPVVLEPGKNVFSVRQEDDPAFFTFEATFVPERPADDGMAQNNRATGFTLVTGSGQVLFIEDADSPGEHDFLIDRLRSQQLAITVRNSDLPFTGLAELQQFDTVVLANVPRTGNSTDENDWRFSDEQIGALVRNTEQMGCGLVMLGGENSFGAGGWNNTEIEAAMPVDFQIQSAKVVPKGALAMVMHASELAQGNYWQKVIAQQSIQALGAQDYCGLLHWEGTEQWLWNQPNGFAKVGPNRDRMLARIDRMVPGDMPQFDPTLVMARNGFKAIPDAAVKHMIIISDGDPSPPSRGVVSSLVAAKITVSTVAVGTHGPAESVRLRQLARDCGGKYYAVQNPKALPRIFQREARRVARPLVFEEPNGVSPRIKFPHEMVSGLEEVLPPITGFVLTSLKENPLVEVAIVSPRPLGERNSTILASWTYGVGRAVAFTSDAGRRWTKAWTGWEGYDKVFGQMIRWSMRPVGDTGKFTVAPPVVSEGKVKTYITALGGDDEFLNFLNVAGTVVGPDMKARNVKAQQIAPGRYEVSFDAADAGTHFMMLSTGPGQAPLRVGVNVPYSSEYRLRTTDEALLTTLASLVPKGGQAGRVIQDVDGPAQVEDLLKTDTFRHDLAKATSLSDLWPLLVFVGCCLFFLDVFVRRVTISFAWVPRVGGRVLDRVLRRPPPVADAEYLSRLRSRKAEVDQEIDQKRAAVRFEPQDAGAKGAVEEQLAEAAPTGKPTPTPAAPPIDKPAPEDSYTSRLLKAKQKVWEDRKRP